MHVWMHVCVCTLEGEPTTHPGGSERHLEVCNELSIDLACKRHVELDASLRRL